ncbi:hypothetical protein [Desulfosarcina ovata]|uniref:Lipoprotein n=1 Tax=Desulfosarcina ovata subsp. ovata TaxID=2752305 RepID=A0A5K8AJB9_9BACT|nr:hypothetical protein [Desulfosarcina ovata]BBO92787.1 hypothetical protein DSCOOX_59670 [Desulfosarcina ovata subsp. ovata]
MMRKTLLVMGVLVFLGGCSLAPKYQQPQAPIPDTWPQGEAYKNAQTISGIPTARELSWQDFFTDQKLIWLNTCQEKNLSIPKKLGPIIFIERLDRGGVCNNDGRAL